MFEFITIPLGMAVGAFGNRCRGTQVYNLVKSTPLGRIIGMSIIAATISLLTLNLYMFPWLLASLMLWATFKWDEYWSAEIGDQPTHSKLWGFLWMTLRESIGCLAVLGTCYLMHTTNYLLAAVVPFFSILYLAFGAIDKGTVIPRSEYCIGALWVLILSKAGGL